MIGENYASFVLTVSCVKMVKKNFQVSEGTLDLLRNLTAQYGKKSDGLMITAGLLQLRNMGRDELANAVAAAYAFRVSGRGPEDPKSDIEPIDLPNTAKINTPTRDASHGERKRKAK